MAENLKPIQGWYCDEGDSPRSSPPPPRDRVVKIMLANIELINKAVDHIQQAFLSRYRYLTEEDIACLKEIERRRKVKILMSMRYF
ncbi:hypothetical protein ACOSP7_013309 [Xanthoceras sorbifolium]